MKYGEMQRYINTLSEARRGSVSDVQELIKALDVGIECMKEKKLKRSPKKVKDTYCFGLYKDIHYVCPFCYKRVGEKDNFCRKCGQPLKWRK